MSLRDTTNWFHGIYVFKSWDIGGMSEISFFLCLLVFSAFTLTNDWLIIKVLIEVKAGNRTVGRAKKKQSRKGRQTAESKKYKVKSLQKKLSTKMSLFCLCSAKRLVSSPYVRYANHPNVPVPVVAERRSNAHREHLRRDWMRLMFIGDGFKAAGWPGLKYLSASQNDATRKATEFQRSWSSKAQATSHWFVSLCSIPHDTTRVVSFLRENH